MTVAVLRIFSEVNFLLKVIENSGIILFKPMASDMALGANPHSFAVVSIIPMVINQSRGSRTQFAVFIQRIISFIKVSPNILATLPNPMFAHISSVPQSHRLSVSISVFLVLYNPAILAISAVARWVCAIFVETRNSLLVLASLADFNSFHNMYYNIHSTLKQTRRVKEILW